MHCPALAAKVWPALLSFLAGLGLNRDDSDEGTLLLSLNLPNASNEVATSLAFFRHVLESLGILTTHLFATNHREGLDRMALAECESALRQYVHREYFLAAVESRQGSRQRTNFQLIFRRDGWPSLAVIPQLGCLPMDTMETTTRCCADNPLHIVYRHRVQTSSCHTHGLTL